MIHNNNDMRGAHKLKLTQLRNIQRNMKEKVEKESETLMQLMDLPDFDTSEFIQTLLKSQQHDQVLQKIPVEKKVYFFAKNYQTFLDSQDELLKLQLPKLQQIPKAKEFNFQQQKQQQQKDNFQQSSVLEIIDSFSSSVLQKNQEETLRVLQIVQEMKRHSKYKPFFDNYSTNKIFLETYNTFIDNCVSHELLLKIGEFDKAIEVYLRQRQQQILGQIKINLNLNDSADSAGKETLRLIQFIQKEIKMFKIQFKKYIQKQDYINAELSNWIKSLTKKFYNLIQSRIYQKDQLSDILESLNIILIKSTELQLKGVSLERDLKEMISADLPLHISKVIEIIIDSVVQILKQKNDLYEFAYFSSIKQFSRELSNLKIVTKEQFGIKCATCKGIILVNSFVLILSTLCDQKWTFIQEGVINILINKVALNILNCTLHYWDYYYVYLFFQRLANGRVRHRELVSGEKPSGLQEKLDKIKQLSKSSWEHFQSKLAAEFFKQILSTIPEQLFVFVKYGYSLDKDDLRPSTLSISLVFKFQEFFKQLQFRISQNQLEFLARVFFEYVLYGMQFVLFWSYHGKGTNDKVFYLGMKDEKLLKKVKEFNFMQTQTIKKRNILQLSKLTKHGFLKLSFEIYFFTQIYNIVSKSNKIDCQAFLIRLAKIMAKDQGKDVIDVSRKQFTKQLSKMVGVYRDRPEMMKQYLSEKKKS